ncbi:MAG: AMP-binding protein [Actinobacteria bacterium]|nr:AMP-binding protein [Actinomycetota bacterium]
MGEGQGGRYEAGPADRLLGVIRELLQELHPRSTEVRLDSSLDRDLGLDSLALVELLARAESAFGVDLPDEALVDVQTPRDLLQLLSSNAPEERVGGVDEVQGHLTVQGSGRAPPEKARTWTEVLDWHAQHQPKRVHLSLLQSTGVAEEITYGWIRDEARQMAQGLQSHGARPGDRIALMLPTGRDYFVSFLGVWLAGCVPVPIYPPWRRAQLQDHLMRQGGILLNAEARMLITVPEAKLPARQLQLRVPSLRHVLTVEQVVSEKGDAEQARPSLESDIALLQYTSGSTGAPKGVVLTHFNLLINVRAMGAAAEASADDIFVSWLPLYHDMGLIGAWLASLYYGMPLVVMPPTSFLRRPASWLQAIHDYRGTISASPNFGYELCLNRIEEEQAAGLDLSSWRLAFNGAEPVSPQTVRRFAERFESCGFRSEAMTPVYGLAESSLGVTFPPLGRGALIDSIRREPFLYSGEALPAGEGEPTALQFVGCGRPLEGHQVRIVDDDAAVQPERQQGRIQVRGPSATGGYFRNPQATQELFRGGWLDSGDLGYLADGELFVTGRAKDMVIRMGRNIHPQELEEAVGELLGVRKGRTAVFGAAGSESGTEELVVLTETRERDPDKRAEMHRQIVSKSTDLLGTPPDDVVLGAPGTVLKTSSGKIRRAACKELYEAGELNRKAKPFWMQIVDLAVSAAGGRLRRLPQDLWTAVYAIYDWVIFGLLAVVTWVLVAVTPGIEFRWRILRAAARLMFRLTGMGPQVAGRADCLGAPCVVVANHSSMLDGLVLAAVLPQRLEFVAAGEFSRNRVAGTFLRRLGSTFVDRLDRAKATGASDALKLRAKNGVPIVFFPEGRMSRTPGLQPFRMGAFAVAAEARVPVLPVTILGTGRILRANRRVPRAGRIQVFISPSIQPAQGGWKGAVELRKKARLAILRHFDEPDLEA